MTISYYLSSPKMTVQVKVKDGIIIWGAPIVSKFMGQRFANIINWMRPDVVEVIGAE